MTTADAPPAGRAPGPSHPAPEPLARLLLQWGVPPPAAAPAVTERLGGWLGWADAIGLSQVLAAPLPDAPAGGDRRAAQDWAQAALARVLADLHAAFDDAELARDAAEPLPERPAPLADLLAPYRLHHAQQQRAIAARVATLRERLRGRVAEASPALAQLAALDAVFDRALADPGRQRLAALPALLTRRAERHAAADPRRWRERFWADLQRALRAELDLRLQPVLGLIDALHDDAAR
ncbi:MAG: DUF3348 family protein [Roseateles sp.]|uniref:DUF3348 family protein n=1 Tax=Roseateles sp. TaxID=1971397 RepID=UPI0039E9A05F